MIRSKSEWNSAGFMVFHAGMRIAATSTPTRNVPLATNMRADHTFILAPPSLLST
jgi:hypothetical protein